MPNPQDNKTPPLEQPNLSQLPKDYPTSEQDSPQPSTDPGKSNQPPGQEIPSIIPSPPPASLAPKPKESQASQETIQPEVIKPIISPSQSPQAGGLPDIPPQTVTKEEPEIPSIQVGQKEETTQTPSLPQTSGVSSEPPSPPSPPGAQPSPPPPPSSSPTPPKESPELKTPKKGKGIKKLFFFLLLIIIVVLGGYLFIKFLLPKIGSFKFPGGQSQKTNLTYWGLWESDAIIKPLIDEFNQQNPDIEVEYIQQNHKEYRERLTSAFARGEGPDMFRFHNTWIPMFKADLDPLPSDIMSASEFQQTFYPVAANDLRVGANFVGIPLEIDGLALFYNKKIFATAGKKPPSTWEELRKTAFELTVRDQKGNIQTAGVALGSANNVDHWSDIFAIMMLQNGADLRKPTNKLAADALLFYTLFIRSDKVWNQALPSSTQAFATEKVAMYFAPSWRIIDIKALNPDLDFGVLPIPQLPNSTITWASYWAEGVSAKSENKDAAWKFLKFLSSKESLQKLYQSAIASGRIIGEPYSRTDMAELLQNDPLVGAYIRQATTARSWYLSSFTHDNGINDKISKYYQDAINTTNKKGAPNPKRALETTAKGVSQVLGQYRAK